VIPTDLLKTRRGDLAEGESGMTTLQWTPPQGHADIAPSQFERIENDGYLTIDAYWIIPALLRSVPIEGRVLEPVVDISHLSCGARVSMSCHSICIDTRTRLFTTSESAISAG
jgi:hypothetical protein